MTDRESYEAARTSAFQRDDHICQICGRAGYPRRELGLAAVPVEADNYAVDNLVTVCHECLQEDDQQFRDELREAWSRLHSIDNNHATTISKKSSSSSGRLHHIGKLLLTAIPGRVSDTELEAHDGRLVDQVGQRDNFNCQVCGAVTHPRGRVNYIMHPGKGEQQKDDYVGNHATVCFDCLEWEEDRVVERKVRQSIRIKSEPRSLSLLYGKAVLRDIKEKVRLHAFTGRLIFFRRLVIGIALIKILLAAGGLAIGLAGALFSSPQTGIEWAQDVFSFYYSTSRSLLTRVHLGIAILAVGYLAHVVERERAYRRERFRNRRRRGETPTISYARPRWQFVAAFAVVGLVGAVDWLLVSNGVFPAGMLFGAVVLWLIGSVGVAYYLRYALREGRDVDGQPIAPAPWVFAARVTLFVGSLGIVGTVANTDPRLSPLLVELAVLTTPVVGLGYVVRRYIERRTQWGARLLQSFRAALDRIRPWDEQWPPAADRQRPSATESNRHDSNSTDSNE